MGIEKPYLDIPGTTVFDADQARKGYWLNQFAMSLMQATGVLAAQQSAAQAALEKAPPDALKNAPEADRPKLLAELVEQQTFDQLRGNVKGFENLYGTLQGADFQATVNQSLYFALSSAASKGSERI